MPYTRVMHNPLSRAIFQLWLGDVQQEICEMNSKCSQCRHTGALLLALMTRSIQFNVKFSFVGKDLFLVAVESALLWVGIARFSPFFAIRFFCIESREKLCTSPNFLPVAGHKNAKNNPMDVRQAEWTTTKKILLFFVKSGRCAKRTIDYRMEYLSVCICELNWDFFSLCSLSIGLLPLVHRF